MNPITHRWPIRTTDGIFVCWAYGHVSSEQLDNFPGETHMILDCFEYPNGRVLPQRGVTSVRKHLLEEYTGAPKQYAFSF